jgi:hypothetical protein
MYPEHVLPPSKTKWLSDTDCRRPRDGDRQHPRHASEPAGETEELDTATFAGRKRRGRQNVVGEMASRAEE